MNNAFLNKMINLSNPEIKLLIGQCQLKYSLKKLDSTDNKICRFLKNAEEISKRILLLLTPDSTKNECT